MTWSQRRTRVTLASLGSSCTSCFGSFEMVRLQLSIVAAQWCCTVAPHSVRCLASAHQGWRGEERKEEGNDIIISALSWSRSQMCSKRRRSYAAAFDKCVVTAKFKYNHCQQMLNPSSRTFFFSSPATAAGKLTWPFWEVEYQQAAWVLVWKRGSRNRVSAQ